MFRATRAVIDALSSLLRAREYADEVGVDPWKFAVEWRLLKVRGLEETDVRYLVARGLVEFRREISLPGAFERTFIAHDVPRLSSDTAFVLTPGGVTFCRSLGGFSETSLLPADPNRTSIAPAASPAPAVPILASDSAPHWNADDRELSFRGQLVKRFKVPAPNQERILSAFQEEGWPHSIDDPLPPEADQEPIRRLQATIKSLNRNQVEQLVRFRGNGNGDRVVWEVVERG